MKKPSKVQYVVTELMHHVPFSVFGVMLGLLVMGVLTFLVHAVDHNAHLAEAAGELYHVFHPSHILLSAVTATAMFMKHDGNVYKAVAVGFVGSITLCSLSDVVFPYFGGMLIGGDMHFHIDILAHPETVLPFAIVGTVAGLAAPQTFEKATEYSHSMHVFVSAVASILYLVTFGLTDWTHAIGGVFMITIFAVMIPCCLSDIIFPLVCTHARCQHGDVMEMEHNR